MLKKGSGGATLGMMVTRCFGFSTAASHCTQPRYEAPIIPTLPLDQGSRAAHSMVSWPSSFSFTKGTQAPPDAPRPRTSCTT
jgi:hypothetical protein